MRSREFPWGPWLLCVTAFGVLGFMMLAGGCPGPSNNNGNGGDTNGGATSGDNNGNGTSGDNNGNGTSGDNNGNGTSGDNNGNGTSADNNGNGTGGDNNSNGTGDTNGGDTSNDGTSHTPPPAPTSISLSTVARTGDAVPGQPSGVTFTSFGTPVIDAKDRVAFWGFYTGTGAKGSAGLYVDDGTNLVKVIDNDPGSAGVVPGREATAYFQYDPNEPDIAWGAGDRLLFCASIQGSTANASGLYRWRATDSNLVRVADRDQVAATFTDIIDNNPAQFQGWFQTPGVSDDGLASFAVHYMYIRDPNEFPGFDAFVLDKNAVFTSNGTTLTKIADDSTQRAGTVTDYPADGYFNAIVPATTMSSSEDMLFQGTYTSSAGLRRGVYVARSGVPYRVIDNRSSASWPGLPSGAQLMVRSPTLGYALGIGPAGYIVVDGRLSVSGVTDDAVILWDWAAQKWFELTGSGSAPATALLSGVNDSGQALILSGGIPYLADGATQTPVNSPLPAALAGATLAWLDAGGAINNNGRPVVPYTDNGKPGLMLWTGSGLLLIADAQLGTPANLAEIHAIAVPEQDRPGRSGMLNDNDDVTFRGVLSDNTQAIYIGLSQ